MRTFSPAQRCSSRLVPALLALAAACGVVEGDPGDGEPRLFDVVPVDATATDVLALRAHASLWSGVGPHVLVRVDGTVVGELDVPTTTTSEYRIQNAAVATAQRIDIVFTNDGGGNGEDRNLFVDALTIAGRVMYPTDAGVTYDVGVGDAAFDGANVYHGQAGVFVNGALRFIVPQQLVLTAAGSLFNGIGPHVVVRVDGDVLGELDVSSTTQRAYALTLGQHQGPTPIDIAFTNDAWDPRTRADRNLSVTSIRVGAVTVRPADNGVTYDLGSGAAAFDGVATIRGTGAMNANGALRFTMDLAVEDPGPGEGEPPPPPSLRTPNAGLVGNNFIDGGDATVIGGLGTPGYTKPDGTPATSHLATLQRYGFIWGLGVRPDAPAPHGFSSFEAWSQAFRAAQLEHASVPDGDRPHVSLYCNSMEMGTQAWAEAQRRIANDWQTPSATLDPAHTWWLLGADGARVGAFPGTYAINLTSGARPTATGERYETFHAKWLRAHQFNHAGIGWGVDNLFGQPVSVGNWLANGQAVSQPGQSNTVYDWPDGTSATVRTQWRKGMARFYTTARSSYSAAEAPELSGNAEISSTDLSEPEYRNLADSILIETPFDGPYLNAGDQRRFWSYEYIVDAAGSWSAFTQAAAAGHPSAAFADGRSYWKTYARVLTMGANTRSGKFLVNSYTPRAGAAWASDPENLHTWRYIFGTCMLMGPKCYPAVSPGSTDGIRTGPVWWNELDQQVGEPVSGRPMGPNLGAGAYRVYENALVVLNPTLTPITVDVTSIGGGRWRRFRGAQAPTVNNGLAAGRAELVAGKDAVLFIKN